MDLLEINALLQDIETNQELLRMKIGLWSAWPILRFNLAALASNLAIDTSEIRLSTIEHISHSFHDAAGFLRVKHPHILLYVASSNRVEQKKDRYKDIIFDELLRYIPTYFKIENINNKFYLERSQRALYPSQMTTSGIYMISNLLSRLRRPRSIDRLADSFFASIQMVMPTSKISRLHIRKVLTSFYWRKILYRGLLHRVKPRILFLQTAYMNHALVAAAKEMNIKVVEFQHGIIDRHHPGYSWTSPAVVYKNHMPLPDLIYVYGDYWQDELSVNGFWNKELRSVGSLHLDQFRLQHVSLTSNNSISSNTPRKIVVTTQALDVDRLISFFIEFNKYATLPVELFIKLHPRESNRQPYDTAFRDHANIHIIAGHEAPSTFELLSSCDYHASIHSTCHYEALGLGKPTIILPFTNHERILPLCEQARGYALLVRTPAEMNQIIAQNRSVPHNISTYYFRDGAVDNILKELHHELGGVIDIRNPVDPQ